MNTTATRRSFPAESIRPGDGCRNPNARPQRRERGSRSYRTRRAVLESLRG